MGSSHVEDSAAWSRTPEEADGPFDSPLFVAGSDVAGAGFETIRAGELQVARMKADLVAMAFEHDRAEIVAGDGTRHPAEVLEGGDMAAEELGERRVEEKLDIERPRIDERQEEGRQSPPRPTYQDAAEVGPIDLRRLARQARQPGKNPPGRRRAQLAHHPSQLRHAAPEAALAQHAVRHRGAQPGELPFVA